MLRYVTTSLERTQFRTILILLVDSIIVAAAFPTSIYLRENFAPGPQHVLSSIQGGTILFITAFVVFRALGVHRNMWRYSSPRDLLKLGTALTIVAAIFIPSIFMVDRLDGIPRSTLVIFWFIAFAGLCSARAIYSWGVHSTLGHLHLKRQRPTCRVMILANVRSSSTIIYTLETQYAHAAHIVGVVSTTGERGRLIQGVEVLGSVKQLPEILVSLDVAGCYPHAIIIGDHVSETKTCSDTPLTEIAPCMPIFKSSNIDEFADFLNYRPKADTIFPREIKTRRSADVKRTFDIVFASTALLMLWPLLTVIAILTYVFHGSPIMFRQVRSGLRLREFCLLKFRTMKPPFDDAGGLLRDRQRITRLGSFLRMTRLDELPQLWNVLKGDMSLIGPRPLLHRDMPDCANILRERYGVRPGITGWAQVNGGHMINNDVKMALDIYYIKNASLYFDLKIILMTIKMMMFGEKVGHHAISKCNTRIY